MLPASVKLLSGVALVLALRARLGRINGVAIVFLTLLLHYCLYRGQFGSLQLNGGESYHLMGGCYLWPSALPRDAGWQFLSFIAVCGALGPALGEFRRSALGRDTGG